MRRRLAVLAAALITLLVAASPVLAGYRLVQGPDPADPLQAHVYKLDNGLTVYLSENHQEPRFHAEIAVRAGSRNDPPEVTGIAHYMEHMLFKGSEQIGTLDYAKEKTHLDRIVDLYEAHFSETDSARRAALYAQINAENQLAAQYAIPNELDRMYGAMGENGLNAWTWLDETVYQVDLPANRLGQWAKIESERFAHPVFRLFQTELETVYEEKNRSMDNKERVLDDALEAQLYKVHPYGHPTLGSVEHLKNPSLRRMYDFYHTYYVPNNMAVVISGDIQTQATIDLIDRAFAAWQPRPVPEARPVVEPAIAKPETVEVRSPGEEKVMVAYRTAPRTHKDAETLAVLDMILDNSVAGLINLNLVQQQRVRAAGSSPAMHNEYGAQYLWGVPKQGQTLDEVRQLLVEQVEMIKRGEFEDWIIPAVVTDLRKNREMQLEKNASRVDLMRDAFLSHESWPYAVRALDRVGKVTKKDVVKAARRYFSGGYVVAYRRDGQASLPAMVKPPLDVIEIDAARESGFMAQVMAMPVDEIEPVFVEAGRDYTIRPLRDGLTLYYAHNPVNGLFSFSATIEVGTLSEKRWAVAAELLDKAGTPRLSAEALKKEWYKLGTDFSVNVGDQETTLNLSGLDANLAPSLSLLAELLQHPVVDPATLRAQIAIIKARRDDALKDHRTIQQALVQYNRYGDMSYFRRVLPNAALDTLTVDGLMGLVSALPGYRQALLYTGSLPIDKVAALLGEHYPAPAQLRPTPPYQVLTFRQPGTTEIYFFHKEQAQALVRLESGDLDAQGQAQAYDEPSRPAMDLFNEYFSGSMAGIVFQELREARALAYSAYARYSPGYTRADQSWLYGVIETQADKTPEAVAAFRELLDQMPVSPERYAAAQRSLVSQYRTSRLGFREVLGAVREWERKQVPVDPRRWRFEQIQKTSLDQVLQLHQQHLQAKPRLISIVGDSTRVGMEALGQQGRIVPLGLKDIFSF